MTDEERTRRVVAFGFTERQAAFLIEVMLHSGFFLGRQYCAFARIVRGQKLVDFLDKLTSSKLATPYVCGHSKAHVYHLHNATLYEAIEQRDVRFRKRMALGRAVEPGQLLLGADQPHGYQRDWRPGSASFGPERHLAYAVQWWSFAALAVFLLLFLNLRRDHKR